jgi:hypothetical protein
VAPAATVQGSDGALNPGRGLAAIQARRIATMFWNAKISQSIGP